MPSSDCVEDTCTPDGPEMGSESRCEGESPSIGNAGQPPRQTGLTAGRSTRPGKYCWWRAAHAPSAVQVSSATRRTPGRWSEATCVGPRTRVNRSSTPDGVPATRRSPTSPGLETGAGLRAQDVIRFRWWITSSASPRRVGSGWRCRPPCATA